MSLFRFLARGFLASYFVADGVKAVTKPQTLAEDTMPLAQSVHDCAERVLPADLAKLVPADPETYVRLHGAMQTVGAVMMATGLGRRLGAGLVALAYLPRVIVAKPTSATADKTRFLRELALLGGVLIEARDTQGKPGVTWLLTHSAHAQHHVSAAQARRQAKALGQALTPSA